MDTNDLETLLHAARLGSFAAAARELGMDPSAVSRAVSALESDLGTRIFVRNSRRMALTAAGQVFVDRLVPLLPELSEARAVALDAVGAVSGRLRITVSNAFGVRWLSPLLPAFCAAYPALELDVILTESNVDLIAERVDLALRVGTLRDSALIAVPLCEVKYRVVASPKWLRTQLQPPCVPQDLRPVACLCFAMLGFRDQWQFTQPGGQMEEVAVRPKLVATNALLIREGALAGLGPALLADWMIDKDLQSGELVDVFPSYDVSTAHAPRSAWAVYPGRKHVPAKVRALVDYLRSAST